MSVSVEKSDSIVGCFRDALPSILIKSRHTDIWGVDLKHAEWPTVKIILEKFLKSHSAIPALQVSRARVSLERTLEWRCFSKPSAVLPEAKAILPELDLCHITFNDGQYVLWVSLDEMTMKGYLPIHESLATSRGLVNLGLAVMEKLSTLLMQDLHGRPACCVIEFKRHSFPNTRKKPQSFQGMLRKALEDLVRLIRNHYPNILAKAYIINPCGEYLAYMDISEALLRDTVLLKNPVDLGQYLGSQLPPRYGGTGESLKLHDCLAKNVKGNKPDISTAASTDIEKPEVEKETTTPAINCPKVVETEEPKLRLIYSETIGPPSIILDPDDLETAQPLCPDKMGARVVFADSDTVVKFGHGVGLGEAEAMHMASTRTTIAVPRLLSAYILDGVGHIVMTYEAGEPLAQYWDRVSTTEHNRILESLRDYVNQMREIPGDFIGTLDGSPCRDGIFEAGYGDYTRYSYGPYPSEEGFNEGIIQALRDRLPPALLEREHDAESLFFNAEYTLYQTVRGLQNHKIVFTHADMHPGNIIVRPDGTLVLLDWGLAGFWPEYWEFYRAMFNAAWRASWDRMVERFIPPFYVEYSVMKRVFATVWY
ncbi:hypothetical protein ASPZODRAFT_152010 [Penicilliopsis zonata CBS 506.65]|uniref:Aminoglycoside phosphotransferase domain-containing protein n=1 Tax=Penicilliopsis zonata CBS 506.65 TaxID=1073090 RepID=A0A1L9SHC5_9EURO|nr:hypothetical protein ASPZODRAFT_152010 [Penicilliopsis zonata CBS 506.65]OJJ46503.1 hypothetical protein ASPZODRAFT_152010 [Penicilliopsis zonata CBS 506.65]